MHRLFVGLRPPPPIRAALRAMMGGIPNARWQDDEQLHATLRFIGEVDRPCAEDVVAALGQISSPAIEASLDGVGTFDRKGRVDTIWAGLSPRPPLAELHKKVDRTLARAGLTPERRAYLPHVTIARLPRSAGGAPEIDRFLATHAGLTSAPFVFEHITLFESTLGHEGARYEPIDRWRLA